MDKRFSCAYVELKKLSASGSALAIGMHNGRVHRGYRNSVFLRRARGSCVRAELKKFSAAAVTLPLKATRGRQCTAIVANQSQLALPRTTKSRSRFSGAAFLRSSRAARREPCHTSTHLWRRKSLPVIPRQNLLVRLFVIGEPEVPRVPTQFLTRITRGLHGQ